MTPGLSGNRLQSVLDPAGPQAARIADLWWLMLAVCAAVFLAVMVALLLAIFRRRAAEAPLYPDPPSPESHRRLTWAVAVATGITVVILFGLLVASVTTGRATSALAGEPVTLKVIGHQWWWEVHYTDPVPSQRVLTANEIHIPVGRPVLLELTSSDVIHSFWVPNLHGKRDLIPGHRNALWLRADRPGVYRGQCAEFCGLQHAHMALFVVAEAPERFRAWLEAQRRPAAAPRNPRELRGMQLVERLPCANCHTIRGTLASGKTGPDLTHLASRRSLAAGTLPNTRGHLAGWILDPQTIKPGNYMPATSLGSEDLQSVLSYLEILR